MTTQDETYDLDPALHVLTLREQRNNALDRAAMWEAIAMRERQTNGMLAEEIARLTREKEGDG